jgi:hypothetical protein
MKNVPWRLATIGDQIIHAIHDNITIQKTFIDTNGVTEKMKNYIPRGRGGTHRNRLQHLFQINGHNLLIDV